MSYIDDHHDDEMREDFLNRQSKRRKAMEWWSNQSFEEKFYATMEWLKVNDMGVTERHPDGLTGREIESIFNEVG